jgi:hypothetical protein
MAEQSTHGNGEDRVKIKKRTRFNLEKCKKIEYNRGDVIEAAFRSD